VIIPHRKYLGKIPASSDLLSHAQWPTVLPEPTTNQDDYRNKCRFGRNREKMEEIGCIAYADVFP